MRITNQKNNLLESFKWFFKALKKNLAREKIYVLYSLCVKYNFKISLNTYNHEIVVQGLLLLERNSRLERLFLTYRFAAPLYLDFKLIKDLCLK